MKILLGWFFFSVAFALVLGYAVKKGKCKEEEEREINIEEEIERIERTMQSGH